MTEKNFFVYTLFCNEILQILVYFLCIKLQTPSKKQDPDKPPVFGNLVGSLMAPPRAERRGVHTINIPKNKTLLSLLSS